MELETGQTTIFARGRALTIHGTVPLYLQWFSNWNADQSAIWANARALPIGSVVIDVGANIGIMSCSLAAQRPDLQIIAIEPVPHNVECLKRNLEENQLLNVKVIHAAASDKSGTVRVNINGPWSAVLESGEVEVPAITLDELDCAPPAMIKIDVEGWEPYVLAGARRILRDHRPLVFMEWNTWSLLVQRHDPIAFVLATWDGFDIIDQYHEEKAKGAPTWDRQLVQDNITLYGSVTDVLMRPKNSMELPALEDMIYYRPQTVTTHLRVQR